MNASTKKSLSLLVALSSAVACGAFVGCSSTDDTVVNNPADSGPGTGLDGSIITPNPDGSTTTEPDGSTTGDDDGSVTNPVDAGPATLGAGSITLSQSSNGSAYTYNAFAGFAYTPTTTATSDCTVTDLGNGCSFSDCDIAPVDAGPPVDAGAPVDAGPVVAPNAGVITITGGMIASAGLTLTPSTDTGVYSNLVAQSGQQWAGGDTITFSAAGDLTSLGAFAASPFTGIGPADVNITAPTFTGTVSHSTTFDRSTPLTVSWTGGTTGTNVTVTATTIHSMVAVKSVSCKADAGSGTLTLPSTATTGLSQLEQANGTSIFGSFSLSPSSVATTTATDNDVSVAGAGVFTVSASLSGTLYSATFTNSN